MINPNATVYAVILTTYFSAPPGAETEHADTDMVTRDILGIFQNAIEAEKFVADRVSDGFAIIADSRDRPFYGRRPSKDEDGADIVEMITIKDYILGAVDYEWVKKDGTPATTERDSDPSIAWLKENLVGVELSVEDASSIFGMEYYQYYYRYIVTNEIPVRHVEKRSVVKVEDILHYLDNLNETMWKLTMTAIDDFVASMVLLEEYGEASKPFPSKAVLPDNDNDFTLTVVELAGAFGADRKTISNLRAHGLEPCGMLAGRTKLYGARDITNFVNTIFGRRYRASWNTYLNRRQTIKGGDNVAVDK